MLSSKTKEPSKQTSGPLLRTECLSPEDFQKVVSPQLNFILLQNVFLLGRNAPQPGLRWNVKGISFLNVWHDPWVSSIPNFKIISIQSADCLVLYIADLIDHQTRQWDENIIFASFDPLEAREILKIQLSEFDQGESLVWHYSKYGISTVKSVYHVLISSQGENAYQADGSLPSSMWPSFWKSIGHVKIPPKIRNFIWRAVYGALASRENIFHRKCVKSPNCAICGADFKSGAYTLLSPCSCGSPLGFHPSVNNLISFSAWWSQLLLLDASPNHH